MQEPKNDVPSIPSLRDRWIRCIDCGCEFVWEAGEQAYYAANNLATPKRCQVCRKHRRALGGAQ